jgi:hypothetical protein
VELDGTGLVLVLVLVLVLGGISRVPRARGLVGGELDGTGLMLGVIRVGRDGGGCT